MDTSGLDTYAQDLREILLSGVKKRLEYWGFDEDGSFDEQPSEVAGGYTFRGQVFDDESVPRKWTRLKNAVRRHDYQYVAEEAAYTWFNRLMATRILEKNGHIQPVLEYPGDLDEPSILTRAKEGVIDVEDEETDQSIREAILDNDEDGALRELLIDFCNRNEVLQGVFGDVSDYTELLVPTGLLRSGKVIDKLVGDDPITDKQYEQVELIGWLYQFYISDKKDEVYDKSGKFEPENIPAATQIFTPRWIVRYLVENTIGRQWLDKYPTSPLRDDMEYLVESENEPEEPIFDDISELQLFDPAAGSGHILVVGFELLMGMYRELGYSDRDAVRHILEDNLYGIDIDRRAVQLARFALLMKASKYDDRVLDRMAIDPQVYAMPEPRDFSTSDLRAYLGDDVFDAHGEEVKEAVDLISEHGQNVGSALKLELSEAAREKVAQYMVKWDNKARNGTAQLGEQALHQELRVYMKMLLLLTDQYPAVAANPPYASSSNINKSLKNYLKEHYPKAKKDLFSTFMEVFPDRTGMKGRFAFITPPNWMFLSSYKDLRRQYIEDYFFDSLLQLSRGIFGADFGSVATTLQKSEPNGRTGTYFRLVERTFQEFHAEHLHDLFQRVMNNPDFKYKFATYEKDESIPEVSDPGGRRIYYPNVDQENFQKIPESAILYWLSETSIKILDRSESIGDYAQSKSFMKTGNNKQYLRCIWEVDRKSIGFEGKWAPTSKGGGYRKWGGNIKFLINISDRAISYYKNNRSSQLLKKEVWKQEGITWSDICSGGISFRSLPKSSLSESAGLAIFPNNKKNTDFLLGMLNSKPATNFIETLNPTMHFKTGDVESIPVPPGALKSKDRIASLSIDSQSVAWEDWNAHETALDFSKPPLLQHGSSSIEADFNAWVKEATDDFFELHTNEEKINNLLIDLYGLDEELSPRVAFDDITILEDELDWNSVEELENQRDELTEDELRQRFLDDDPDEALFKVEVPIRQFLSYSIGAMLGRFRLGRDGFHIAHPEPSAEELQPYEVDVPLAADYTHHTEMFDIDNDAIVPLMGRDSPFNDSAVHRMQDIVRVIWGEDVLTQNLNFINHALSVGRSRGLKRNYEKTMEEWLVEDFWDWHKGLYSVSYYGKKPIYWLFQSPEGHFQVLVYMHRMDKYTPQRVRQDYLRHYREYIDSEIDKFESADELSAGEEKRLDELRDKKADCREYSDILKEVAEKQIEIDLDDGVQNNYTKFGDALADL